MPVSHPASPVWFAYPFMHRWVGLTPFHSCCCLPCSNDPNVPPIIQRWQENNYTWGQPRSWACYRPDADVLVPMYYSFDPEDMVSPFAGDRSISMLMRFAYAKGDGKSLVEHYGHRLRHEIIEYWRVDPLQDSEQGLKSPEVIQRSTTPSQLMHDAAVSPMQTSCTLTQ